MKIIKYRYLIARYIFAGRKGPRGPLAAALHAMANLQP
jgi:hypothetical protein